MSYLLASIHCMDARQQIAQIIRDAIERSGKKYLTVGLEMGCSESTISRYSNGLTPIPRKRVKRLAAVLGMDDSQLEQLKSLVEEVEEAESSLSPIQALGLTLKSRFEALEVENESLRSRLSILESAFDKHIHNHS